MSGNLGDHIAEHEDVIRAALEYTRQSPEEQKRAAAALEILLDAARKFSNPRCQREECARERGRVDTLEKTLDHMKREGERLDLAAGALARCGWTYVSEIQQWVPPAPDRFTAVTVARAERAEASLLRTGWTYTEGAAAWHPPLGLSASPLLDKISALEQERDAARASVKELIAALGDVSEVVLGERPIGIMPRTTADAAVKLRQERDTAHARVKDLEKELATTKEDARFRAEQARIQADRVARRDDRVQQLEAETSKLHERLASEEGRNRETMRRSQEMETLLSNARKHAAELALSENQQRNRAHEAEKRHQEHSAGSSAAELKSAMARLRDTVEQLTRVTGGHPPDPAPEVEIDTLRGQVTDLTMSLAGARMTLDAGHKVLDGAGGAGPPQPIADRIRLLLAQLAELQAKVKDLEEKRFNDGLEIAHLQENFTTSHEAMKEQVQRAEQVQKDVDNLMQELVEAQVALDAARVKDEEHGRRLFWQWIRAAEDVFCREILGAFRTEMMDPAQRPLLLRLHAQIDDAVRRASPPLCNHQDGPCPAPAAGEDFPAWEAKHSACPWRKQFLP